MSLKLLLLASVALATAPVLAHGQTAGTGSSVVEDRQDAAPRPMNFEQFTLSNGLRVVVHEDHAAPKVAVAVWYHVGSMNEPAGKSGFAHLFEHLMFNGSENHDAEYMPPLQEIGVSAVNGATTQDQTYYYEVVPTGGLERVLWLESDRMGHLLGAVTQAKLDEQRGVVQNEKRTSENRPYSSMPELRARAIFPEGHPYHHPVIGSMADLDAASLDDVRQWFRDYYGATNAVVVLAGDVTVDRARELMERYFASVPPGAPVGRPTDWTPTLDRVRTETVADNVPQPAIAWTWPVPGHLASESQALRLASFVLGRGRLSRLHNALVIDQPLATDVNVNYESFAVSGMFNIEMRLRPGVDPAGAQAALETALADFLRTGPTEAELERFKIGAYGDNIRTQESLFVRAMMLAGGTVFDGDPGQFEKDQAELAALTADQVHDIAREWLARPNYRLNVVPQGVYAAGSDGADRTSLPPLGATPDLTLPARQEGRLSNGLRVLFSRRTAIPTVEFVLSVDAGSAADQTLKRGVQGFAVGLMDDGTRGLTGEAFAEAQARLGTRIYTYSDADTTNFALSALGRSLEESVSLWADYIREPGFRAADIERERGLALSGLQQAQADPDSIANGVFNALIYGADHAYGTRLEGRREQIESYTRDDLLAFHSLFIRPDNATLYVAGDAVFEDLMALLERQFGDWRAPAQPQGAKTITEVAEAPGRVILIDKPGAIQSIIRVGHVAPNGLDPRNFDMELMNDVLGGTFTARLNSNLRETRGWTYGASSGFSSARGPQAFGVSTSIQTDKTAEALGEIRTELTSIGSTRPATAAELDLVRKGRVLTLSDQFETNNAMVGYMREAERLERPYDWITTLPGRYAAATPDTVTRAASVLHPAAMNWVVVGDLSKIETGVRALGLGEVEVWDPEGRRLR